LHTPVTYLGGAVQCVIRVDGATVFISMHQ